MARTIKGTRDILPAEMPKWHAVEQAARDVFARYGFEEIRTPIFEETELFVRSIGESKVEGCQPHIRQLPAIIDHLCTIAERPSSGRGTRPDLWRKRDPGR